MNLRPRLRVLSLLVLVGGALGVAALLGPPEPDEGVVVEKVRKGTVGDQADLRPEDVLLSWRRASSPPANPRPAEGKLRSPFDLTEVLIEQLPRGNLTLSGRRGRRTRTWFLPGGSAAFLWDEIETRPALSRELRTLYNQGKKDWSLGEEKAGDARWSEAAARASARNRPIVAGWLLAKRAEAWSGVEEWTRADALYGQIVEPLERRGDWTASQMLRSWGSTFRNRGSWARAEDCFQRALRVDQRIAPRSLAAAWSLTELGYTASWSAGSKDPEDFLLQARALREQLAPGSSEVAASWYDLGADADTSKDYTLAEERYKRALALQEALTPEGSFVTELLTALALVRFSQQDLPGAERIFQRALALAQRQGLEGLEVLAIRRHLGKIAEQRGDLPAALDHLQRAVALAEKLPGSWRVAEPLHDLGLAERRAGRLRESAGHLCRAVEIGEHERRMRQWNEEERIHWGQFFGEEYRDCAEALVDLGQSPEAFQTLEKGRARAALFLLGERPLRLSELPPGLAAEREQLAAKYDGAQAALERSDSTAESMDVLLLRGRIREIRRQQEALDLEIRRRFPSFAALHAPEPLDVVGARQTLDPGTVLVSYSAGQDRTVLFVVQSAAVGGPGLRVYSLAIGKEALQERIIKFRALVQDKNGDLQQVMHQAESLYELLLKPAEPWLSESERILVCPDGPLQILPFAALVRDGHYLIEWKPIHVAPSATVYAELKKKRHLGHSFLGFNRLIAFGDPMGASLPASREEIRRIAVLFPWTEAYLGREATEGRFRQVAAAADLIHLAVHAELDEHLPLNSSLIFSQSIKPISGRDNGRLQDWEILDGLHLSADLVTLSACGTALGRQMDGEGLVSLARAFQLAGSRSVLATLWAVSDTSSASFMSSFYFHLHRGESKDRALQAAQIEQIQSRFRSHPFHWATFQLFGAWSNYLHE